MTEGEGQETLEEDEALKANEDDDAPISDLKRVMTAKTP